MRAGCVFRRINMAKIFSIMVLATMLALIAPAIAQLPSEAVAGNREDNPAINRSIINQYDPTYVWKSPYALDLSGISPAVFGNIAFANSPGGMSSALYTESINEFLSRDPGAGKSNITVNTARVGLTTKAAFVGSSVRGISAAPQSTAASPSAAEMQNETT